MKKFKAVKGRRSSLNIWTGDAWRGKLTAGRVTPPPSTKNCLIYEEIWKEAGAKSYSIWGKVSNKEEMRKYLDTSGFWPRVRARALRAPVFLGSLPRQTGRCAPPLPAHRSFLFDPQKYLQSIELGPPTSRTFFFPLDPRGYEIWCPLPPAPPIAASLILPAIFLGSNYVPMRPYALIFSFFFFFYSFWIFSFCYSLLFLLSFSISSYSSLLILLFLSLISSYSSLLILLFLSLLILLIPAPPVAASGPYGVINDI